MDGVRGGSGHGAPRARTRSVPVPVPVPSPASPVAKCMSAKRSGVGALANWVPSQGQLGRFLSERRAEARPAAPPARAILSTPSASVTPAASLSRSPERVASAFPSGGSGVDDLAPATQGFDLDRYVAGFRVRLGEQPLHPVEVMRRLLIDAGQVVPESEQAVLARSVALDATRWGESRSNDLVLALESHVDGSEARQAQATRYLTGFLHACAGPDQQHTLVRGLMRTFVAGYHFDLREKAVDNDLPDPLVRLDQQVWALACALQGEQMPVAWFDRLLACIGQFTAETGGALALSPQALGRLVETLCIAAGGEHMPRAHRRCVEAFVLSASPHTDETERAEALWGYLTACKAWRWLPMARGLLLRSVASAAHLASDCRGRLIWCLGLHFADEPTASMQRLERERDLVRDVDADCACVFASIVRAAECFDAPVLRNLAECLYRVAEEREQAGALAEGSAAPSEALKLALGVAPEPPDGMVSQKLAAIEAGIARGELEEELMRFSGLEWD